MRTDIEKKKKQICEWIKQGKSKSYICKNLNCRYLTLERYLKNWGIKYKGVDSNKAPMNNTRRLSALEYMNTKHPSSTKIKKKLIEDGIREHKCEKCKRTTWINDVPIPLELHHIDGNHHNNILDNYEIICPNCHALKPNNCGASFKKHYYCAQCSNEISKNGGSGLCKSCIKLNDKKRNRKIVNRPSKEILLKEIEENGYAATGRKYGVSDNAVRKWLK